MGKLFPEKIEKFIRKNVVGVGNKELTEMVNEKFGTVYTSAQVKNFKRRNHLSSGLNGQFLKGHIPANKGKKGKCAHGCDKTWFKKGCKPVNHKPVGSERIDRDGYTLIKVAEPSKWRLKQHIVWEEYHGVIPKGYKVIFLDSDTTNFDIDNLMLVTDSELLILNRHGLKHNDADITKTGVTIAKLIEGINRKKR